MADYLEDPFAKPGPGAVRPFESGTQQTQAPGAVSSIFSDASQKPRLEDAAKRAQTTAPDTAARIFKVGAKTGLPTEVIERNLDTLEQQIAEPTFDAEKFRRESPLLADWLAKNPHHMAVAQDDLRPLAAIERGLSFLKSAPRAVGAGLYRFATSPWGAIEFAGDVVGSETISDFARSQMAVREHFAAKVRGEQNAASDTERALLGGFESLGFTLGALPAAVVTGGAGASTLLSQLGFATGSESYSEARKDGVGVLPATGYALSQAAIEVATERIPAKWLMLDLAKQAPLIGSMLRQAMAEVPGEQIATAFQDLNTWAVLNPERPFQDFLEERPGAAYETLVATLVAVGGQSAVVRVLDRAANGKPPMQRAIEEAGAAAAESKLRERAPEKYAEAVEAAVANGVEELSVPVERFVTYWQEQGEDPAVIAEAWTGDPGALARAQATGDLNVPTARYVTQVAHTEHNAFFAAEVRDASVPRAMNAREELEFELREVARQRTAEPELDQVDEQLAQIRGTLVERLKTGGQFDQAAAETYAHALTKGFRQLAAIEGTDLMAFAQKWMLQIESVARRRHRAAAPRPAIVPPKRPLKVQVEDLGIGTFVAKVDGQEVGRANVADNGNGDYLTSVNVVEEHRRRGVATQLYEAIERTLGRPLRPSPTYITPDGLAFWQSRQEGATLPLDGEGAADTGAAGRSGLLDRDAERRAPGGERADAGAGREGSPGTRGIADIPAQDAVFFNELVAGAVARGRVVNPDELAAKYLQVRALAREGALDRRQLKNEHGPAGLLQAIADAGGISAVEEERGGGSLGEINQLQENLGGAYERVKFGRGKAQRGDAKTTRYKLESGLPGINGPIITRREPTSKAQRDFAQQIEKAGVKKRVAGVQKPGKSWDGMFEYLNGAGFEFESLSDMIEAIFNAVHVYMSEDEGGLTAEIHNILTGVMGVRPDTDWFDFYTFEQRPADAARQSELEALATDEAMGVTFPEDGPSLLPDGSEAVNCTNCARRMIQLAGNGEVFGWEEGSNPTSVVAGPTKGAMLDDGQGHDFAIIDGHFLVDAWAKNVEMSAPRAVFDLNVPSQRAEVLALYGDPKTWVRQKQDGGWEPAYPPQFDLDVLDTGEEQPRLPGAEDVREQELDTPEFDLPFALTPPPVKRRRGPDDNGGQTLFQRAGGDVKDLVIQHNLTAGNLLHAAKMGGIPAPSLAVVKKNQALTDFGEITLLGPQAMADPRGYARTRVFGSDIYSPRYPTIHYKFSDAAQKKLRALTAKHAAATGLNYYDLDELQKKGLEELEHFTPLMAEFLESKGMPPPDKVVEPDRPLRGMDGFIKGGVDHFHTRREFEDLIERTGMRDDFRAFAAEFFQKELNPTERIFRGLTYSGNRSYQPHTIENVVKILKKELRGGESPGNVYGVGQLRARFVPEFKSLASIKAAKNRLLTTQDFEAAKNEIESEFEELTEAFKGYYKHQADWRFGETVMAVIEEGARKGIPRALKEYGFEDVPIERQQELAAFMVRLRNMPTEYFEAKILRGVDLAEFRAAVVPSDASKDVIDLLHARGVEVFTYKRNDDTDRRIAIESAAEQVGEEVLFQPAWHGSPHEFDRFSLHAIGTGEGNQAYGWGLYFAGRKDVAEFYREVLSRRIRPPQHHFVGLTDAENKALPYEMRADIADSARSMGGYESSLDAAVAYLRAQEQGLAELEDKGNYEQRRADELTEEAKTSPSMRSLRDEYIRKAQQRRTAAARYRQMASALRKLVDSAADGGMSTAPEERVGRVYKVEIPESEDYLDWDKSIEQQSPKVRKVLESINDPMFNGWKGSGAWPGHITGRDVYKWLAGDMTRGAVQRGMHKEASEKLAALGIAGIRYLDGSSRKKGEGSHNFVVFDDKLVQIMEFEQQARGSITFSKDPNKPNPIIRLFEARNLSTFWHESGHLFLKMMGSVADPLRERDPATLSKAQRQLLEDYDATLKRLGVDSTASLTGSEKANEQFAREFEAYMMEGIAPSVDLRRVFARARAWLLAIYDDIKGIAAEAGFAVRLNPEVRAIFDRLLASDAEIAEAEAEAAVDPAMFTSAEEAGWTPEVFDAYKAKRQKIADQARERVQRQVLKEMERERRAWWKDARAAVRAEVAAAVYERREYKALAAMVHGTNPDGTTFAEDGEAIPMKMSRQEVSKRYGKAALTGMPRGTLTSANGMDPEVLAEMFEFANGLELVNAMRGLTPMNAAIEIETDRVMKERHGDMVLDGSLADRAREAVMLESARADVVEAELKALAALARTIQPGIQAVQRAEQRRERAGRQQLARVPSRQALQRVAERHVAEARIGTIRPLRHFQAARQAAVKAMDLVAVKDYEGALRAKTQHLLNLELYRAAVGAVESIDATRTLAVKMFRPDGQIAKSRNMDMVAAARAIVARYFFPARATDAFDALEKVKEYDPELYDALAGQVSAAVSAAGSLRELTFEQFVGVRDAAAALWEQALRSEQVEIDGERMQRAVVVEQLEARMDELGTPEDLTPHTERQMYFLGAKAAIRRVEHWVRKMDGGRFDGAFRRFLLQPIVDGTTAYRVEKPVEIQTFLDTVKPIEKTLVRGEIAAPELAPGFAFKDRAAMLHALLHSGNESNLRKLLLGYKWGRVDESGNLDESRWRAFVERAQADGTLTKADYDFAQAIWNQLEALKPKAQRAHREMYGHTFAEITARPIETPWGSYAGGYVPAIADPLQVPDAAIRDEKHRLSEGDNAYMFPTTGRGFTKSRTGYAAPLALDLRLVPVHIDKVLRFIHIEPRVKDVARLVWDKRLRLRLDAMDPTMVSDMLIPWLQRAASQKVASPSKGWGGRGADAFFREVRTRTGLNIMVGNVVNTLQQFTGVSIAALRVKPRYLRNALWNLTRDPAAAAKFITDSSPWMRSRVGFTILEQQNTINDLLLNPSKYDKLRDFGKRHGYFMQAGAQSIVDKMTWLGAYEQAIANGEEHKAAVLQADAAVRETQGSFAAEDVSRIETGTPWMRAFTMFYSYFNMNANVLGTDFSIAIRQMGLRKGAGRALYVYTFGFMIPAVLSEMIRQAVGGFEDDDDESNLDEFMAIFFGSQARTAAAMVPFAGQLALAVGNTFNDKPYDDRISTSPAITALESAVRAPREVYNVLADPERSKKRAVRDTLTLVGLLTGVPVNALAKPLGYLADVAAGEEDPDTADLVRGLVSGRPQREQ